MRKRENYVRNLSREFAAGRIIPRVLERRRVRAGAGEDDDHELDRDSDDNDQPPMGSDSEDSHNDEFIDVGEMLAAGNDPEDDDDENEASQASTEEL